MSDAGQKGADFRRLWSVAWRRKWVLLAILVLTPLGVYALSTQVAKSYEASTTVLVQPTSAGSVVFTGEPRAEGGAEQAATLAETTLVARRAARILGQAPAGADELLERVQVEAGRGDGKDAFVSITAEAASAERAARIANAFATALARTRTTQAIESIDRTIATLRRVGGEGEAAEEALQTQLQQLRGLKASQTGTTVIVDRATPADAPYSPRPLRNALLALIVALLVAAGLVPLLARLDRRLREPGELEELLEAPLLATIPDAAFPGQAPDWHVREAFQTLRAGLVYFNVDRPLSTLVVTSPAQWEGKTTVAINLAIAYARDGQDTILVDADLRHPQVAKRLGREPAVGLETVLAGERSAADALLDLDAGSGGRLRILPSAVQPPNPAALLGSQRMRSLLAELSEQAEVVIVDTPALLAVSDAMPLVSQAAGAVLVARMGVTTRDAAERASHVVRSAGGSILGTVATGVRDGGVYGYYGYYEAPPEDRGRPGVGMPPSPNGAGKGAPQAPLEQ